MGKRCLACVTLAFGILLSLGIMGCGGGGSDSNPVPTSPVAAAPTSTPTALPTAPATTVAVPTSTPTATATITPGGPVRVAEAVARNSQGVARHLNQTVTTEGTVTVAAGVLANKKLKIFAQDGLVGIMVYHPDAGSVTAYQPGDRIAVTGKVVQADPGGENVLTGTVMVDISVSGASAPILSSGNTLPTPQPVTLDEITVNGFAYMGALVSVQNVRKVAGDWPKVGAQSTSVAISDDGGTTQLTLRFQKNTITPQLVSKLNAIGNGPFHLAAIAVQNAVDGNLLGNFEIWIRAADDITTP